MQPRAHFGLSCRFPLGQAHRTPITPLAQSGWSKFPRIHLNRRFALRSTGPSEVAQALAKKAADLEAQAVRALGEGDLVSASESLMGALGRVQRMLKDEDNFGDQKEQLFNRLAEGMKRLGSIEMRQSRHQEAVLILDKALKLRERDFEQFKDVEAATKIAQSGLPEAGDWEETHVQRQRKRAQAENLIDYAFTMSLLAKAKLQHLQAVKRKYRYQTASEDEKALFLQTAEEAARNLDTANVLLTTSIIEDALRSYNAFAPSSSASSAADYLAHAIGAAEKEKVDSRNQPKTEINSLGFWKGNLFEQKLLQAKIENAIQRADLQNSAGQPQQALKILVTSLRESSHVFENYLEGLSSLTSPFVARLICHIVETRRMLLKEREKPQEIRDDEGEEEVGWVITNTKVNDFLSKGDILLTQAMQALRHRHDSFADATSELKAFESLSLWEGDEALSRCLYNQGVLALMRDTYFHNVAQHFHLTLPDESLEDEQQLDDLVTAMVRDDGLLGEDALWEAYQLRKKFYGNDATHAEALKCLLPLVRAYNRQGQKQQQVINLLEPVLAELESKQQSDGAEDKSEWVAKCLNLLAEAREQDSKFEEAEKLRMRALQILKQTRGPHDYETVQALRGLAAGFLQRDLYPEAEKLLKAVLKSWKQSAEQGLDMTFELVDVLHDLGTIQAELKRPAEAEESFRLAAELAAGGLGETMKGRERKKLPEVNGPTLINTMGWFLYTERKYKDAIPLLEKGAEALERKERLIGKLDAKVRQLFAEMQQIEREDSEEAAAGALQRDDDDEEGSSLVRGRESTGEAAAANAEPLAPELKEKLGAVMEPLNADREMNARQLLNNLEALVELYTMEGLPEKTLEFAQREVQVMEELLARGHAEEVELAEPLEDLAHALQATGQPEEAAKALERSLAIQRKHKM